MADNSCALNPDGSLKDASEIDWAHSPTSEQATLPPITQKKRKPSHSPARRAGGKRVKTLTSRAKASEGTHEGIFFARRFNSESFFDVLHSFAFPLALGHRIYLRMLSLHSTA